MSSHFIEHRGEAGRARPTLLALLGYLFPAFAMIFGAWLGAVLDGSEGATALGAIAGFLGALTIARIVIGLAPRLSSLSCQSHPFPKE